MYKILVCDPLSESAIEILKEAPDVEFEESFNLSEQELIKKIDRFNAIIVRSATIVTSRILDAAENLRVIGRAGTGLDNIDIVKADKKGVKVFNTPGTNAPAVAELTIGLLFALARQIPLADKRMKDGQWTKKEFHGVELDGKTLGLIGCGVIGKLVAQKAYALGMDVLVFNRSNVGAIKGVTFEQVALNRLLGRGDFISVHLPKSAETVKFIGREELNLLKESAYLINTARGEVVDEEALLLHLKTNKIAGAAIDVFKNEPDYNRELAAHPRVIATPHIAAASVESQERVGIQIVDKILEYLRSKYIFL